MKNSTQRRQGSQRGQERRI